MWSLKPLPIESPDYDHYVSWEVDSEASIEERFDFFHDQGLHYPSLRLWLERGHAGPKAQVIDQVLRQAESVTASKQPIWVTLEDGKSRYISTDDATAYFIRQANLDKRQAQLKLEAFKAHIVEMENQLCKLQKQLRDLLES